MTPATKMCYNFAIANPEFQAEMLQDSMKNKKPNFWADQMDKVLYATIYYGWILAKANCGESFAIQQLKTLKELRCG